MKTVDDILVVGKKKVFKVLKNDVDYYLQLSIVVSKEEYYSNRNGTKLRLESEVEYK